MTINSLKDVYIEQLKDMYSAEKQLTEALPKMAEAAHNKELSNAFNEHLAETETHMEAVRAILDELGENPTSTKCKAMEGLIEEGDEITKEDGDPQALDAAIIVAAQKVEYYEIASYGSLATFASTLGYKREARILQCILDQEYEADQLLDDIAMGNNESARINILAKS